jgi:hypothetical protein
MASKIYLMITGAEIPWQNAFLNGVREEEPEAGFKQ